MRAEALHGKGSGHTNLLLVVKRLIVQIFKLSLGSDGLVYLLLSGNTSFPPISVQFFNSVRPLGIGVTWNLPFLPRLFDRGIQLFTQLFQLCLPLVPDNVDLGVVGNGFERDMWNTFINEAVTDISLYAL